MKKEKLEIIDTGSGQTIKATLEDYANSLLLQDTLKRVKREEKTLCQCFWQIYYYKKSLLANNFFYSQVQDIITEYVLTLSRRDKEDATCDDFFMPLEEVKPKKNYFDLLVNKIRNDEKLILLLKNNKSYRSFYRAGFYEVAKVKQFYNENIEFFN